MQWVWHAVGVACSGCVMPHPQYFIQNVWISEVWLYRDTESTSQQLEYPKQLQPLQPCFRDIFTSHSTCTHTSCAVVSYWPHDNTATSVQTFSPNWRSMSNSHRNLRIPTIQLLQNVMDPPFNPHRNSHALKCRSNTFYGVGSTPYVGLTPKNMAAIH
jgi:hypothetical protein